jgi:hypothetical protein
VRHSRNTGTSGHAVIVAAHAKEPVAEPFAKPKKTGRKFHAVEGRGLAASD